MKSFEEFCDSHKEYSNCKLKYFEVVNCRMAYKEAIKNNGKIIIDILSQWPLN